jgi:cation transport regulator ChaC
MSFAATTPLIETITKDGKHCAICGFGSLLSKRSAESTCANVRDFKLVLVKDFRRVFAHTSPVFFETKIANGLTREIASLSVERAKGYSFIGTRFEIPIEEYASFAAREREFDLCAVETIDLETGDNTFDGVLSTCCVQGADEKYVNQFCLKKKRSSSDDSSNRECECVKCKLEKYGEGRIWTDEHILPTRTYARHCVLAAKSLGDHVYDDFVNNTYLADRTTTLRVHLERNPSIMEELPPESLKVRYGG